MWAVGYFTILLIVIVYVVNFVFMLWVHCTRVKLTWRERKYRQKKRKWVKKRHVLGVEEEQKFERLDTQCSTNRLPLMPAIKEESSASLQSYLDPETPVEIEANSSGEKEYNPIPSDQLPRSKLIMVD